MVSRPASPEQQELHNARTLERADLSIKGMSCAACVGRIEGVLAKQAGIDKFQVNLMTERGTAVFDPSMHTPEGIADLVSAVGFPSTALAAQVMIWPLFLLIFGSLSAHLHLPQVD